MKLVIKWTAHRVLFSEMVEGTWEECEKWRHEMVKKFSKVPSFESKIIE